MEAYEVKWLKKTLERIAEADKSLATDFYTLPSLKAAGQMGSLKAQLRIAKMELEVLLGVES